MRLYEPARHERTRGANWSEARACAAIEQVVAATHHAFSAERLWPIHPFDRSPERPLSMKPLYFGAAGVIWAIDELGRRGAVEPGPDYSPTVRDLVKRHHDDLRANTELDNYMGRETASYLIGDVGMLMLQWKMQRSDRIADRIHAALQGKVGDARGLLWGAAGSMVAAVLMHERTSDPRWASVFVMHFDALWSRMRSDESGCWAWVDELYRREANRCRCLFSSVVARPA